MRRIAASAIVAISSLSIVGCGSEPEPDPVTLIFELEMSDDLVGIDSAINKDKALDPAIYVNGDRVDEGSEDVKILNWGFRAGGGQSSLQVEAGDEISFETENPFMSTLSCRISSESGVLLSENMGSMLTGEGSEVVTCELVAP